MKQTPVSNVEAAINNLVEALSAHQLATSVLPKPYIIAIAGKVAVGKSFFVQRLMRCIREKLGISATNLAFEIWLDPDKASQNTFRYEDKFFLNRFVEDVTDLSNCVPFFLMHTEQGRSAKTRVTLESKESDLKHRGRSYSQYHDAADVAPLFKNQQTCFLERKMIADHRGVYIIDGTLVLARREVRSLYDASVYLDSPWILRLARMRSRFCRGENHNMRESLLQDYVTYLAEEAVSNADAEVETQQHHAEHQVWNDADPNCDVEQLLKEVESGKINLKKYL